MYFEVQAAVYTKKIYSSIHYVRYDPPLYLAAGGMLTFLLKNPTSLSFRHLTEKTTIPKGQQRVCFVHFRQHQHIYNDNTTTTAAVY